MTAAWLLQFAAALGVLFIVAAGLARRFDAEAYGWRTAIFLSGAALAQPAYIAHGSARASLLSLATYAVSSSGVAFIQRQDPRRVVLLAASLAGAQFIDPLWGIMATLLLPVTLRRSFTAEGRDATRGLYVCLLFLPGLTMLSLIYFALFRHAPMISWNSSPNSSSTGGIGGTAAVLVTAIPLGVVLAKRRRDPEMPVLAAVAAVIIVASAVAELFGPIRALLPCSAAFAVLSAFVASRRHALRESVLLIGTNLVLGWLDQLFMENGHA